MDNVLVFEETEPAFLDKLSVILKGYNIMDCRNRNADSAAYMPIDKETALNTVIIFGNAEPGFLKRCPRLKWMQLHSAGANRYVNGELKDDVLLTCASGIYGISVSEHMVALTFCLLKNLHFYRDEQSKESWKRRGRQAGSIYGSVVLVIGLGDIGTGYAVRMKAMGCYVIGVRRTVHAKPDYLDEILSSEQMEEALPRADVVALIVPGTKETAGLISRSRLAKMKKGAIIINAGRGTAIDTEALCDSLESGALGGAGLDVTDPEPLPPGHRLWKMENAVITPHEAGAPHLSMVHKIRSDFYLENASRFMRGEPLKSRVDFRTGYRIPED